MKASPTSSVLPLLVVPHVGETDTDTLTGILDRAVETEEEKEAEDEFGYNWGEFSYVKHIKRALKKNNCLINLITVLCTERLSL